MKPVPKAENIAALAASREGVHRFPRLFGLHDFARLDTTPGADSPFAPRSDWHPSPDEYVDALRAYCRSPCGPRQHLMALARHAVVRRDRGGCLPEIAGPYAEPLRKILGAFVEKVEERPSQPAENAPRSSRGWRKTARADSTPNFGRGPL